MKPVYWLFCTVIDNFGDIGVSWRLAQSLQNNLNAEVWLWIDNTAALSTLVPEIHTLPAQYQNIHIRAWQEGKWADLNHAPAPQVVIETFACTLPDSVLSVIQHQHATWINWEYLSAEDWAIRTHAMPSLQSSGVAKYFWQMGFSPDSGGLLRESDYLTQYQSFTLEQQQKWRSLHQLPPKPSHRIEWLWFGYASPIWSKWLHTLQSLDIPLSIYLSGGQILQSLKNDGFLPPYFGENGEKHWISGSLELHILPFLPQSEFDRLLWSVDAHIIRGEDSFVRSQYTGKPFFWHIYQQEEQAHIIKLDAFWQKFWTPSSSLYQAHHALSYELNHAHILSENARQQAWHSLLSQFEPWQHASQNWQNQLFNQTDAVSRLKTWLTQHQL